MVETQQSLTQPGISMFLSFGAKSVKPEILEKLLVGRQKTVDMLTQQATDIAQNGLNAQLMLIGNRGMGKTHVLRVLYHRIQPLIQSRQMVVAYFIEEAYDVASYLDFLVRIIKDFVRWYPADAELLQQKLSILRETPNYRQEELAEQIVANYVDDKPLLILTENFDTILEALGKGGQAKLRSWLYRHNRISIMATAQALSPDLGREDRPFYQFFTAIYLKRLSYEDSLELLRSLAQTDQNQIVIGHLNGKGIGQVRAIHELVKGNHRLLVTFYEFLKADTLAKLSDIFMKTLNDLKPYYETYIRYLPPQQQKIVHYLALAVTPRNGTDIAKDCFIDSKSLSKQLSDLQRNHLLDAHTDPADGRNKLYDLSEPLLRISLAIGEHTQGITPLFIDFLANWHNINDLENQKDRFWQLHLSETNEKLKQDYLFDYEARVMAIDLKGKISSKAFTEMMKCYDNKEYQKVIELSENIIEKDRDEVYCFYLGNAYDELGQYDKAIECYQKAIDIKPDTHEAFYNMGYAYRQLGEHDKAIECYQKTIDIKPDKHEAFNNMGNAYNRKGEYDKAIECYQKSIDIKPDYHEAFNNMGYAYVELGQYDKAIECYQKAIDIKPDYHEAFNNMGYAYDELGEYDKAIECYQKAIDIKPDKYEAFNNMGYAYRQLGENDKAIECYQKAIDIKPDIHEAFNNMGYAYGKLGEYNKAIECYQKTIDIKPDYHQAFYNMGNTYGELGENDKAVASYQKAIETGVGYVKTSSNIEKDLEGISDKIIYILKYYHNHSDTIELAVWPPSDGVAKIQHLEKFIEQDYGLPDELKIAYLMLQTYRRYVLQNDKRAIYELPKEQREFFLREIVGEK